MSLDEIVSVHVLILIAGCCPAPTPSPDSGVLPANVTLLISGGGQSNEPGSGSTPPISTVQPYSNKRLNRTGPALDPLVETTQEGVASGMANWLTAQESARVSIVDTWAIGGTAYAAMKRGTTPYANALTALGQMSGLVTGAKRAVNQWCHGETDDINGVSAAVYAADLVELQRDWESDSNGLLGAHNAIPLIYSQVSQWPQYAVSRLRSTIALAQLSACLADPVRLSMSHPTFPLAVQNSGGAIHFTNAGELRNGELFGKTVRKRVILGEIPKPLHISRAVAVGNIVTLSIDGGDGSPLALDVTNMRERVASRGFEYTDSSGSPAAIIGTTIYPVPRKVELLLRKDATLSGIVRHALTAPMTAPGGPTGSGVGGNIRDTDPTPSASGGSNLWNWLSVQERPLDSFSAGASPVAPPPFGNNGSGRFASSKAFLQVPSYAALDGLSKATFACRVKLDAAPGSNVVLFGRNVSNHRQVSLGINTARALTVLWSTGLNNTANAATASAVFSVGASAWHDLVFVLNNGTAQVYLDGVQIALVAQPTWPSAFTSGADVELGIGGGADGVGSIAAGNMRDAAIWLDYAATQANATELRNGGTVRDPALASFGAPATLFRFDADFADYGSAPSRAVAFDALSIVAVHP